MRGAPCNIMHMLEAPLRAHMSTQHSCWHARSSPQAAQLHARESHQCLCHARLARMRWIHIAVASPAIRLTT